MQLSSATKFVIAIGIVISLMLPGALILPRSPTGSTNKETPIVLPPAELPSQPLANQAKWEEFTGQGGEWNAGINQSLFTRNVTMEELRVLVGEEALRALNGSASGGTPPTLDGEGTVEYSAGAVDQSKAASGTAAREVEEADIVKLQGSLLYVLNSYRGLIIVDLSNKDRPSVSGALRLQGYPQDMYVVGNLSFVILSASYGYWYNYYTLPEAGRSAYYFDGGQLRRIELSL